jgi:GNAT superfamily N-acetyltransferase
MASSILKSNLLLYHFGREAAMRANELKSVVSDCIFEREPDTLQVEYLYVSEEHRGKGLPRRLYSYIEQEAGEVLRRPWKAQVQCYPDRLGVWTNLGFSFHARRSSAHPDAQRYLPDREKIQMEQHYK